MDNRELDRSVTEPAKRRDAVEAEAAAWVIRLGGDPLRAGERRALDRWLAEHADHQAAFDYARSTWAGLAALRDAPGSLSDDIVPSAPGMAPCPVAARFRPRTWVRAGALAATVLIAFGLGILWLGDPITMLTANYRTAPAETRTVALPDGSTADLGPASAVALRFDNRERRIELLAGVVYVTAAPMAAGEGRPFVVEAANGTAEALGTRFIVERLPDAVEVTVTEHRVEVAAAPAAGPVDAAVLSPGQSVRYGQDAGLGPVEDVSLDHVAARRRGRLVFDRAPLSEVVAALNRYRHGRIVVADTALGGRRVSGVFDTSRLDEALASIARELGARTAAVPPFVTLLY
jgi:transmembrane sensor